MDKQILEILQRMENKIGVMETKINSIETQISGIQSDIKGLKEGQERIEKKLESVHEQADKTAGDVTGIIKDLYTIEMITAKNWGDLVTLKAVSRL